VGPRFRHAVADDVVRARPRLSPYYVICNRDRKSTRLNSSHSQISYAVFCLKKKKKKLSHRLMKELGEDCDDAGDELYKLEPDDGEDGQQIDADLGRADHRPESRRILNGGRH